MKIKQNFLFLSISLLGFLRCASGFGIGMALPLYYYGKLEGTMIGFISSAVALSYLFSPYIFRNIYKKIGMKMCLVIANSVFVIDQIGLQFCLDLPIMTYLFLFFDGIVLGLYWPVITGIFTVIYTQENDELKKKKINRNFGLSWNIGGTFGYLLSAFALFIISDILLIFDLSLTYTIIGLIIALLLLRFNEGSTLKNFGKESVIEEEGSNPNTKSKWNFPLYIPLLFGLLFALITSANGVLYPIKSKLLNFSDFSAYITSFVRLIVQTTFISYTLGLPIQKVKKAIPFLMLISIICLILLGITQELIVCIILSGVLGIFFAFCHSFSFRLTIDKNMERNDMKATTYFETILGIAFFVGPIMGGFLADISIILGYSTLAIILLFLSIVFISLRKRIEFNET
jgi:MFS family permease